MNDRERRSALQTLVRTKGWEVLTGILTEERERLLTTIVQTRPVGDKTYDIAEMQGQVRAFEAIPILVENLIDSLKPEDET